MVTDQKLSVAEAARRLGVHESRLHEWKKAIGMDGAAAFPGPGHQTPVEEENRRLRAEVKRLEMERDILKKATALFAGLTEWTCRSRVQVNELTPPGGRPTEPRPPST